MHFLGQGNLTHLVQLFLHSSNNAQFLQADKPHFIRTSYRIFSLQVHLTGIFNMEKFGKVLSHLCTHTCTYSVKIYSWHIIPRKTTWLLPSSKGPLVMPLAQAYLCTWSRSPAVVWGLFASILPAGPPNDPPCLEWAEHVHLSSPWKRSPIWLPWLSYSRSAACSPLWSRRISRSRRGGAEASPWPRPPPRCWPATALWPGNGALSAGTSPFSGAFHTRATAWIATLSDAPRRSHGVLLRTLLNFQNEHIAPYFSLCPGAEALRLTAEGPPA